MRTPQKSNSICKLLRERIMTRYYLPGEQLPHETDLASELGISRNTLRAALSGLEEEQLLKRIKGKGTFVAEREKPLITLLLPCENFLLQESRSAYILRQIYTGVFRAVRDFDCRLETIAVSATNTPTDITPGCLDSIGKDSLVIFSSTWFESIFQQIHERGAKISLLDAQLLRPTLFPFTGEWNIVDFNSCGETRQAVELLYQTGARRIAFASEFIRRKGYPTLEGYQTAIRSAGLPDLSVQLNRDEQPENIRRIRNVHKKSAFDALIISAVCCPEDCRSLHEYLDLPENVRIFVTDYCGYRTLPEDLYAYSKKDPLLYGYDAVKALMTDLPEKRMIYNGEIHFVQNQKQINYA